MRCAPSPLPVRDVRPPLLTLLRCRLSIMPSRADRADIVRRAFAHSLTRGLVLQTIREARLSASEVAALRAADLRADECRLIVRPRRADAPPREEPISGRLAAALRLHLEDRGASPGSNAPLLAKERGPGFYSRITITQWVTALAKEAGVTMTALDLRRPDGALLDDEGLAKEHLQQVRQVFNK